MFSVAMIVVGFAVAVAVNLVVKEMPSSWTAVDATSTKLYSLTDTTNKKFEDLQNDPEALKNIMEKNPAEYERLLNDYIKRNGK